MQFLMQMSRGQGQGKTFATQPARGLNSAGGAASGAGSPLSGNAAGKNADGRSFSQAAGVIEVTIVKRAP